MHHHMRVVAAILVCVTSLAQDAKPTKPDPKAIAIAQEAAIAALTFRQGDVSGFTRVREDFTSDGWKDFIKQMEGFLDQKGAPTFTSSFVASHDAKLLDEKDGLLHLRIPGTLTQSSNLGRTTYRAAIEVYVLRSRAGDEKAGKIQRLEQITCAGASTSCQ